MHSNFVRYPARCKVSGSSVNPVIINDFLVIIRGNVQSNGINLYVEAGRLVWKVKRINEKCVGGGGRGQIFRLRRNTSGA